MIVTHQMIVRPLQIMHRLRSAAVKCVFGRRSWKFSDEDRSFIGVLTLYLLFVNAANAQETAVTMPPPTVDEPRSEGKIGTVVFAGGCYWGTQGLFEHVVGVRRVTAGLAKSQQRRYGGAGRGTDDGTASPAEAVSITYDRSQITLGQLLQIFFSVAHDPTELNRQGPDEGPRYRSEVFYQDEEQMKIVQAYIAQLGTAHVFPAAITTRFSPYAEFHRVDFSQQDYLIKHPTDAYIVANDLPKIVNLKRMYPSLYRAEPVRFSD